MFTLKTIEKIVSRIPYKVRLAVYHTPFLPVGRVILGRLMPSSALVEITAGALKGFRMWVNLKCQKYYWLGTHEPAVQEVLRRVIRRGWVCYDIGAHIGYFSLTMAWLSGSGGKVFSFEPDPDNFWLLNEHIRLNNLKDVIRAVPFAVSSSSGRTTFQKGADSYSPTGKLSRSCNEGDIEVEVTSLDEFVRERGHLQPDFIKIDVEGFEGEVLSGANKILTQAHPVVLCEIHNLEAAERVYRELRESGYSIYDIEDNIKPVTKLPCGRHWIAWHKHKAIE